jgi:hypothetical protein
MSLSHRHVTCSRHDITEIVGESDVNCRADQLNFTGFEIHIFILLKFSVNSNIIHVQ